MRRLLAVAVLVTALPLASCSSGGDADRYVLDVHGVARVGAEALRTGKHKLAVGQTVTIRQGSAVLGLPGDTSLELRRGSRVTVDPTPVLVEGDALAVAGDDDLHLRAGGADVDVQGGAARLRRTVGVTVAVYAGSATVRSLGGKLATRALRQVTITDSGALPRRAVPLAYDRVEPDPWDTRYLNDAIDLGGQVDREVRLLNARPAPTTIDLPYLQQVVPAIRSVKGLDPAVVRSTRSVGETVAGASIALGGTGDLGRRWTAAFSFRDQGADWGLVALDQRAQRASVLSVLNGVLDRVVAKVSPAASGSASSSGPGTTVRPTSSTTTTTPPRRGSATTPEVPTTPATPLLPPITLPLLPSPPPTTPTQPSSPPTVPSSPTPTIPPVPLLQPVEGLLGGLLGGGGGGGTESGTSSGSGGTGSGSLLGGLLDGVLGGL